MMSHSACILEGELESSPISMQFIASTGRSNESNCDQAQIYFPSANDPEFESFLDITATSCKTCSQYPKVVALLDRWIERRLDLTTYVTLKAVWKFARKLHNYQLSVDSLRRHLQNCRTENYEKVRVRE